MPAFGLSFSGNLGAFEALLGAADKTATQAGCYALNHTVAKARTEVNRSLSRVTGLSYGAVAREIKQFSASMASPSAELQATGPYHLLSEFNARQTAGGVSASPWGKRRVFPHTFIVAKYGGGVFERVPGKALGGSLRGRFPIRQLYGPAVPKEMLREETVRVWERTLEAELPARMLHEWARLL